MKVLSRSMSVNATSVVKDPDESKILSTIQDKAPKALSLCCKTHYNQCLLSDVEVENSSSNKTYTATTLSYEEIVENHKSVLSSFGLSTKDDDCDLPSMYWISKLHKNPYKQRHISGSAKCTTTPLSSLLISILTAAKKGLQFHHNTCRPCSGTYSIWILENLKDLLEILNSRLLS